MGGFIRIKDLPKVGSKGRFQTLVDSPFVEFIRHKACDQSINGIIINSCMRHGSPCANHNFPPTQANYSLKSLHLCICLKCWCFMIYANYFTIKLTCSYNLHDLITRACTRLNYRMTKRNVFLEACLQNWVKHKFKTWRGPRKWNIHNLHKWQMLGIMWENIDRTPKMKSKLRIKIP
jgi:hypothetical protein